jgi:ATP-binding cassette subfamily B multidrug efflux pump
VTTIGIISAGVALSLRLTSLADWIFDSVWSVFQQIGALRESLRTIGQPLVMPQKTNAPALKVTAGGIKITNLQHHYGKAHNGLDGISLTIKPGEKVGLIGKSGAGKSTLVNLILRFFEAEGGSIEIDGQEIRTIDQDSLRNAFGMVTQQAALFNRSVRDNIDLGRDDIDDEEMIAAAKEAKAHDFIVDLEDTKGRKGYDAFVGERGIKLSGGQRQRIALARAILKNAPIMILDEATSALDSEVEAEIQDALAIIMKNKTVIAIAHRLSTIAHMDRIVVLDKGRIVEQGSHDELLKLDGHYARFWNRQSGGFIDTSPEVSSAYGT